MLNVRRVSLLIVATALLSALPAFFVGSSAVGQPVKAVPAPQPLSGKEQPKQPEFKPGVKFGAIKLVEDEEYQKSIDGAMDAIEGGDWQDACDYLQAILDAKEDVMVRVEIPDPKTGGKKSHSVSAKTHANNLLALLPPDGLNTYELKFGAQAKLLLDKAKATGSREILAEVASRLRNTKSGGEANEMLATSFMDRGEYPAAALRYERLVGPDAAKTKVSDLILFKATLAFKRAGDSKKASELWDVLAPRLKANGGLALANGQVAPLKQVQEILSQEVKSSTANPHDWAMVGGNNARNAQAKGSPPMLDYVLWQRQLLRDKSEDTGEEDPGQEVAPRLNSAFNEHLNSPTMAALPGGFPVAANGLLFYRTYAGLTAVYLRDVLDKEGKLEAKAGSVHFKTTPFEGAIGTAFANKDASPSLGKWIDNIYQQSHLTYLLFENSSAGTLTTDNRNVYAVDDLALPIPPKYLSPQLMNSMQLSEAAKQLVFHNKLRAFNIASGKIEWELGATEAPKSDQYANTHFLCAPISVGGKLYVLNEKNSGDLRLLCLDPATGKQIGAPQKLGTVKSDHIYFHDIARRANAIHLAYAEGILVCPTNAGEILGVDLMSQSLAWAYKYRDKPPNPGAFPIKNDNSAVGVIALSYSNWKASPPVIVDGKVVFTAPDSNAVCCINLRDGTEIWSSPQHETDLYMAGVVADRVVIVGKNSIRALKLADGTSAGYPLQTGDMPSGQGVASNNIYYLPLRKGEICAIDVEHWAIKAHNRAKKPGEPPGNLVFYEGMVLSQTAKAMVAYPQLAAKLAEAEKSYINSPSVKTLLDRGELRLADGQVQKAVDDLIAVLAKDPPADLVPRARNRLHEALSDLLQTDFASNAGKYLKEYKELTKVPGNAAEQLQREAKYWRILAHGREAQGDLVDAFVAYKEFGGSPLFKNDGIPSLEDPLYKVPTHLWLRSRISAMFEKATPTQRAALEKKIGEEWAAVVNKKDNLEGVRQFISMFDVPFKVGREARIELANTIIQSRNKDAFLEAELNLQQLRVPAYRKEPQTGGKALEALARLEVAKGSADALRLAAAYYSDINKDFAKDILHAGKTGSELYQALAEDPRLRPFLEEPAVSWSKGDIKHRELRGDDAKVIPAVQGFVIQPEGDLTPLMRQHRLFLDAAVNINNPVLHFVDVASNKLRWSTSVGPIQNSSQFFQYLYTQNNQPMGFHPTAKFRFYQVKGHLAVIQVGMEAVGVDLDAGKVLWHHPLFEPSKTPNTTFVTVNFDDQGRLWAVHNSNPGGQVKTRVGHIGTVQATYVALITHKGLVMLDPLKGTVLWTKTGLASNTEIFGDDQHIYYVETADGAAVGAGRCLRTSDGAQVDIPDFGFFYRNQQRIFAGRRILTAEQNGKSVTMRLYDVPTGKDLWKRSFGNDPAVLKTEDPNQCGMIERDTGKLVLLNAHTGQEIVTANMQQFRVTAQELKELHNPVLLDDGEYYFVALNVRSNNVGLVNNTLSNNFVGGVPCLPVNGWLCCLDRKGEFLWHGHDRFTNQMIVTEQFKTLPVLVFSSRHTEQSPNGQYQHKSRTGSISKIDGKAIWWSPDQVTNGRPEFFAFNIDLNSATINLVGNDVVNKIVVQQLYADDKRNEHKDNRGGEPGAKGNSGSIPNVGVLEATSQGAKTYFYGTMLNFGEKKMKRVPIWQQVPTDKVPNAGEPVPKSVPSAARVPVKEMLVPPLVNPAIPKRNPFEPFYAPQRTATLEMQRQVKNQQVDVSILSVPRLT